MSNEPILLDRDQWRELSSELTTLRDRVQELEAMLASRGGTMNTKKDDGGPAFPVDMLTHSHGTEATRHWGMSLRDYAMIEMMKAWRTAEGVERCLSSEQLVTLATADVDAFMEARK